MGKKKISLEEFLKQYDAGIDVYKDFASTVRVLLEQILKKGEFKCHSVVSRVKDRKSLENKLKKDDKFKRLKHVSDIKDLAGCRIQFYIESDILRILPLIREEFNVTTSKLTYSKDGYNDRKVIVTLKSNRLKLPEYAPFKGLKCEVQLTTVLYHAWSELEHDIIYKPEREIAEFDKRAYDSLKARFAEIMEKQIKEAQHGFDFIQEEVEKIKQGKKIFDKDFINSISTAESNNSLYEALKILLKYVEMFGDKTPKEIDLIDIIEKALEKSSKLPKLSIKTVIGDFAGYGYLDVLDVCIDILNRLRFTHLEKVFGLLVYLSKENDPKLKKKIYEAFEKLSKYTYWPKEKKIYFNPQLEVLSILEKWNTDQLISNSSVIAEIGKHILEPSYEGHTWTSKTVTYHHGSLNPSETIAKIRTRMIDLLINTYSKVDQLEAKMNLLQSLYTASELPHDSNYSDDLEGLVLDNINILINFYTSLLVKGADNEIVKQIEHQLRWFKRRFPHEKMPNLNQLQELIDKNLDYKLFRIFVGDNVDYYEDFDWQKAQNDRKIKMNEIIDQISDSNYQSWLKKLLLIIKNHDLVKKHEDHSNFFTFLNELGKRKPNIALKLIEQKAFEPFLLHLITGVWCSSEKAKMRKVISAWLSKELHLRICAYICVYVNEVDEELIKAIFVKAKKIGEVEALTNIIRSIFVCKKVDSALKELFIDAVKELTKNNNTWWAQQVWFKNDTDLLDNLSAQEWAIVLDNLAIVDRLNYDTEEILSKVAVKYPKEFIGFFERRVKLKNTKNVDEFYDVVPFEFAPRQADNLLKLSTENKDIFLKEIFKWFNRKDENFHWHGAFLLEVLFPHFDQIFEDKLIGLLKSKNPNRIRIVKYILRAYKGESFLHNVCKELIKQLPKSKRSLNEMYTILDQSGLVSGEYGFVNLYKAKINDIQPWKKDKNKTIRNFAESYELHLQKRIDEAQKDADEEIDKRKRQYGE